MLTCFSRRIKILKKFNARSVVESLASKIYRFRITYFYENFISKYIAFAENSLSSLHIYRIDMSRVFSQRQSASTKFSSQFCARMCCTYELSRAIFWMLHVPRRWRWRFTWIQLPRNYCQSTSLIQKLGDPSRSSFELCASEIPASLAFLLSVTFRVLRRELRFRDVCRRTRSILSLVISPPVASPIPCTPFLTSLPDGRTFRLFQRHIKIWSMTIE